MSNASTGSRDGVFISTAIAGQSEAERFMRRLDSATEPDALFAKIVEAIDPNDPSQARLRGLARGVQKAITRGLP